MLHRKMNVCESSVLGVCPLLVGDAAVLRDWSRQGVFLWLAPRSKVLVCSQNLERVFPAFST